MILCIVTYAWDATPSSFFSSRYLTQCVASNIGWNMATQDWIETADGTVIIAAPSLTGVNTDLAEY